MCDGAWILDNWGSLRNNGHNQMLGYRYWRYHMQMYDKEIVQEVARWGNGHVAQDRSVSGEPNWQTTIQGVKLLRFLEYNEPCMTNDAKREVVLDAIADLRAKYGVLV